MKMKRNKSKISARFILVTLKTGSNLRVFPLLLFLSDFLLFETKIYDFSISEFE